MFLTNNFVNFVSPDFFVSLIQFINQIQTSTIEQINQFAFVFAYIRAYRQGLQHPAVVAVVAFHQEAHASWYRP